ARRAPADHEQARAGRRRAGGTGGARARIGKPALGRSDRARGRRSGDGGAGLPRVAHRDEPGYRRPARLSRLPRRQARDPARPAEPAQRRRLIGRRAPRRRFTAAGSRGRTLRRWGGSTAYARVVSRMVELAGLPPVASPPTRRRILGTNTSLKPAVTARRKMPALTFEDRRPPSGTCRLRPSASTTPALIA